MRAGAFYCASVDQRGNDDIRRLGRQQIRKRVLASARGRLHKQKLKRNLEDEIIDTSHENYLKHTHTYIYR